MHVPAIRLLVKVHHTIVEKKLNMLYL